MFNENITFLENKFAAEGKLVKREAYLVSRPFYWFFYPVFGSEIPPLGDTFFLKMREQAGIVQKLSYFRLSRRMTAKMRFF